MKFTNKNMYDHMDEVKYSIFKGCLADYLALALALGIVAIILCR